jgi:putative transposase
MTRYRKSAHTVFELHYHFVFTTKYRKPALRGDIALKVRDLIRVICEGMDVEILAGHVRPDHVHLFLSVPPSLAPSRLMQAVKGKTSHRLLMDWRSLRREFWGQHLWARGYFVCSSGNVTDDMIRDYVINQGADPEADERFRVTE